MSNYKEDLPDTTETTCPECGEVTVRSRWYYGKGFCNRQCNTRYQNRKKTETRVTATCQGCQVEFWHWPSDTRKYCSRTCADKGRTVVLEFECARCGNPTHRYSNEIGYQKYCSSKCRSEAESERSALTNMSEEEYQLRLEQQGGVCAICQEPESGVYRLGYKSSVKLAKDHCHDTGEWRGLLCRKCNQALGLFGDNVAVLLRAADYVANGGVPLDKQSSQDSQ